MFSTQVPSASNYQFLRSPEIGQYPQNKSAFQCYAVDWFMESALVQPVTGFVTLFESIAGTTPTGTFSTSNSIQEDSVLGGFRVETMWTTNYTTPSPRKETCSDFTPGPYVPTI